MRAALQKFSFAQKAEGALIVSLTATMARCIVTVSPGGQSRVSKNPYNYSNTIAKCASLATGSRLWTLRDLCEKQKTISTRKLSWYLDKLSNDMKQDAIHFRVLADRLNQQNRD